MIPKINKFDYYYYAEDAETIVQLIGEATDFHTSTNLSNDKIVKIKRHHELCGLLIMIEFSIESYGYINFFTRQKDLISDLPRLCTLLADLNYEEVQLSIEKGIEFYNENKSLFDKLDGSFITEEEHEKLYTELDNCYNYYFDLHEVIESLANKIRLNPDEYCLDEKGESLGKDFTGTLESFNAKGNLQKRYSFVNGKVKGECMDFYFDGSKENLSIYNGLNDYECQKKWHKNGSLKYELYGENNYQYWYENGQLEVERKGNVIRHWDENGIEK